MTNGMGNHRGGIRGRLGALELRLGTNQEQDPTAIEARKRHLRNCEESWRTELENVALDLAMNSEPSLTFRDEAFYTLDGRLAASRIVHDLRALMGPETEAQQKAIPPERWYDVLADDEAARGLVSDLRERAEDADVPEDYWTGLGAWPHSPEILAEGYHAGRVPGASEGPPPGVDTSGGEPLLTSEDQERSRRLAWALIHEAEARELLEELCRRRDLYVSEAS